MWILPLLVACSCLYAHAGQRISSFSTYSTYPRESDEHRSGFQECRNCFIYGGSISRDRVRGVNGTLLEAAAIRNNRLTIRNQPLGSRLTRMPSATLREDIMQSHSVYPEVELGDDESVGVIGAGYVGSAVIEALQKQGKNVKVTTVTNDKVPAWEQKLGKGNVFYLPLEDEQVINSRLHAFLEKTPLVLISVAPRDTNDEYDIVYYETVDRFVELLKQRLLQGKALPKRIVYLSSAAVYGDISDGSWIDEDSAPGNLNNKQKILTSTEARFAEIIPVEKSTYQTLIDEAQIEDSELEKKRALDRTSSPLKVTILRLGGIVGPGRYFEGTIQKLSGQQIGKGGGETFINLVHIQDVVKTILWAFLGKTAGAYNLNAYPVLRRRWFNKVADFFKLPHPVWQDSDVSGDVGHLSFGHIKPGNSKRLETRKLKDTGYSFCYPCILDTFDDIEGKQGLADS